MTLFTPELPDVTDFKRFLRTDPAAAAFLAEVSGGPVTITRAPGRLDVMGGVADYSGSLVAEMTIAEAALVALSPRMDRTLRVWSRGIDAEGHTPQVSVSIDGFYSPGGSLLSYDAVQTLLRSDPQTRWAAYVFGCVFTLLAEGIVPHFSHGANILLDSRVPLGAGVSSSAAIEVATMQALNAAFGLNLDGVAVARLSQMVENKVVGAPCGIMDQMTSALGARNSLLLILCQPHEVQGTQALPEGVQVYGINSNVKHSVGGTAYTRARVAAFMGRKILGHQHPGLEYLANLSASNFAARANSLPGSMSGYQFLCGFDDTGDSATTLDLYLSYAVRACTRHGILENARVKQFVAHLTSGEGDKALKRAGELMYESHESYSQIGLGCDETDRLVNIGRQVGVGNGIYGAKITGGGSGGTVAFLTHGNRAAQTISEIAAAYQAQTGLMPQIFTGGQSPGAMAFGSDEL